MYTKYIYERDGDIIKQLADFYIIAGFRLLDFNHIQVSKAYNFC